MQNLVLDSSVLVASVRADEEKHRHCLKLVKMISEGRYFAFEPLTVFVEVVSALKRRTGSELLAKRIGEDLFNLNNMGFLEFVENRAMGAAKIARQTGLRGMDSIVVQVCLEMGAILVTLDNEMMLKSRDVVESRKVESFK